MTDTPTRPIRPSVPLSIPLTLAAHQQAQQAYQQQREPDKAKQVYLNVLAVGAVRTYLEWMGYAAAPLTDDSGEAAVLQVLADLAELEVPGRGRLACRPVLPGEVVCRVPPESWAAALGYVAVGLDAELRQASLLGYGTAAASEGVPLGQLLPMAGLLSRLQVETAPGRVARRLVDLSEWLAGQVTSGWQAAEEVLGPQPPTFSFRSLELSNDPPGGVVRGRLLELVPSSKTDQIAKAPTDKDLRFRDAEAAERQLEKHQVALLVGIIPNNALQYDIRLKLCPTGGDRTLPENLEIRILDSQGLVAMEAQARQTDMLQLNFRGTSNEQFTVEVSLDQVTLTETFVI